MIQYITLFHLFWPLNPLDFFFDLAYLYLQAMRIPCPQTQGIPQTIMGPPHQVLSSGGSILYPIQISQSGPSLMTGGPVVISQAGQQVPPAGSMIISHPGQHQPQGPPMVVSQTNQHPQAIPGSLTYHGRFQWPVITAQKFCYNCNKQSIWLAVLLLFTAVWLAALHDNTQQNFWLDVSM